jgi:hypothetical protein
MPRAFFHELERFSVALQSILRKSPWSSPGNNERTPFHSHSAFELLALFRTVTAEHFATLEFNITWVAGRCQAQGVEARASTPFLFKSDGSLIGVRPQGFEARALTPLAINIAWVARRCQAQEVQARASGFLP